MTGFGYLELDRLTTATGAPAGSFCTACLSGVYPVPVPELEDAKLVLEQQQPQATLDDAVAVPVTEQ